MAASAQWLSATADLMGSKEFAVVSTRRNTSAPAAPALRSARYMTGMARIRPTGRPKKMVTPAMAPRRTISPGDTAGLPHGDRRPPSKGNLTYMGRAGSTAGDGGPDADNGPAGHR